MKKPAPPASPTPPSSADGHFFQNVYEVVRLIPPGRVSTYGAIARYLGTGQSSRAVGYALNSANLDAITLKRDGAVPAHRVINRLGQLTGRRHFPTPTAMQERLEAEGVRVQDDTVVDFDRLFWDPGKELL